MKSLLRTLLSFMIVCNLSSPAVAQGTGSGKDLNAAASSLIRDFQANTGGKVGVSTQVLKTGKVPFTFNGSQAMIPASNLKLVTTAAALDTLGPDYRFETRLYGSRNVVSGEMKGDLVLKGAGDPTFYPPFVDSATSPFKDMAKALKSSGIKKVGGDLIIDDSDFSRQFISSSYHDRYLLDSYAAAVGGLGLGRNVVTVSVGPKGLTLEPDTGSIQLVNDVKPGYQDQIWVERARGTDKVVVHGVAQPGGTAQTTLTVNDPVRFAGSAFFRILGRLGIAFGGTWKTVAEGQPASLAGKTLLARHRSPVLKELVKATNVESDNILAQHLFRRMGATVIGYGNIENSEAVVRQFFKKNHINDRGLKMTDGSGLSEDNRIAPYQFVYVLKAMWSHKNGQIFMDSLPGPGEGTMSGRLGGVLIRAKTGTLNNHSGLTGYVVTAYGETVGFSILINDVEQTWPAVELQDRIVSLIAHWDRPL